MQDALFGALLDLEDERFRPGQLVSLHAVADELQLVFADAFFDLWSSVHELCLEYPNWCFECAARRTRIG